jgi:S1-C subfamily serine protease
MNRDRRDWAAVATAVLALSGGAAATEAGRTAALEQTVEILHLGNPVGPASADIGFTQSVGGRRFEAVGSGWWLPSGHVVTARHVLRQAWPLHARDASGTLRRLRLIGADEVTDLALLAVDGAAQLQLPSTTQPALGSAIFAGGTAFGLGIQVVSGEVTRPEAWLGEPVPRPYIQTDLPIVSGASGGPVFDTSGDFIGLASFIYSGSGAFEGVSFLTPSVVVAAVTTILGGYGVVTWQDPGLQVTAGSCVRPCAEVLVVAPQSPWYGSPPSSILVGDAIVAVDGAALSLADAALFRLSQPIRGNALRLTVIRGGREIELRMGPDDEGRDLRYSATIGAGLESVDCGEAAWQVIRLDLRWVSEDGLREGDCITDFDLRELEAAGSPLQLALPIRRHGTALTLSLSEPR